MDIIATILARNGVSELKSSGGVGYTTPLSASFTILAPEDITSDVTLLGYDFKWFSSITPTQEEFLAGTWIVSRNGEFGSIKISDKSLNTTVAATATGAYCINMAGNLFIVSTVLENELGTLPKTGIYHATNIVSEGEVGNTHTLEFPKTIHTIDPKYLPGVCLPVVELSTDIPLDGTETTLNAEDSAKLDKVAADKLPFIAQFPVSLVGGTGAMTVQPLSIQDEEVTALYYGGMMVLISQIYKLSLTNATGAWVATFAEVSLGG